MQYSEKRVVLVFLQKLHHCVVADTGAMNGNGYDDCAISSELSPQFLCHPLDEEAFAHAHSSGRHDSHTQTAQKQLQYNYTYTWVTMAYFSGSAHEAETQSFSLVC